MAEGWNCQSVRVRADAAVLSVFGAAGIWSGPLVSEAVILVIISGFLQYGCARVCDKPQVRYYNVAGKA